ncbi:MAG: tyrosine-protein phosphatase [archaeon]|nr:tyrosine-protein phosphatase [archaeon]
MTQSAAPVLITVDESDPFQQQQQQHQQQEQHYDHHNSSGEIAAGSSSMAMPQDSPVPIVEAGHTLLTIAPPPPGRAHAPAPHTQSAPVMPGAALLPGECPQCNTKGIPQEFLFVHTERHCYAKLAVAPVLKELHRVNYGVSLANFRDLGGWEAALRDRDNGILRSGRIRKGLIFRSSSINRATDTDTRIIVHQLKIKSLLDLRTEEYAGKRGPFLSRYFRVLERSGDGWVLPKNAKKKPSRESAADMAVRANASAQRMMLQADRESEYWGEDAVSYDWLAEEMNSDNIVDHGRLFPVGLVGNDFKRDLLLLTPKKNLVRAGVKYIRGAGASEYREAIVGAIFNRPDGLDTLYKLFVDSCAKEVYSFFMTLLAHADLPAVIYCNHGKDRTGFICALILSICGVDPEIIFDNYALSDEFLRPIAIYVESEMSDGGLVPAIMARSPRSVIRGIFVYLETKFGSVQNYLSHIGFGPPLQELLFYRLVEFDLPSSTSSVSSSSSSSKPTASKRGATLFSEQDMVQVFNGSAVGGSGPFKKLVWELSGTGLNKSEVVIAGGAEPVTYNGVISEPGEYQLAVMLLDTTAEHYASVQLSMIYQSGAPSLKQRTIVQPPFTLSPAGSIVLLRPLRFKPGVSRIEWRMVLHGGAVATRLSAQLYHLIF